MSTVSTLNIKSYCLYCGSPLESSSVSICLATFTETKDTLLTECSSRNDSWAQHVRARLLHVYDIPAAEAAYHDIGHLAWTFVLENVSRKHWNMVVFKLSEHMILHKLWISYDVYIFRKCLHLLCPGHETCGSSCSVSQCYRNYYLWPTIMVEGPRYHALHSLNLVLRPDTFHMHMSFLHLLYSDLLTGKTSAIQKICNSDINVKFKDRLLTDRVTCRKQNS